MVLRHFDAVSLEGAPSSLDWLVVGGGIHGVHIAASLLAGARVNPSRLRIIDPEPRLLARWRRFSAATGMTHLRSPSVHHLDPDPHALQRFASKRRRGRVSHFALPYSRPSLELFDAHCDHVIANAGLADLHIEDRVIGCEMDRARARVQLARGAVVEVANVVLALGSSDQPYRPEWARGASPRVQHVFEARFDDSLSDTAESVAVVGGGISACQVALRLHEQGHLVHLVTRHPLRAHQFDSDPGWLGPKLMASFSQERDPDRRRAIISRARHRGSAPPDVLRRLERACAGARLRRHEASVLGLDVDAGAVRLRLASGVELGVERVLLATGFSARRTGGAWVDELVESAGLACASCGYPIVDQRLRWHPRVFVSGPLAELELGPVARNIAGARRAADRLVPIAARDAAQWAPLRRARDGRGGRSPALGAEAATGARAGATSRREPSAR